MTELRHILINSTVDTQTPDSFTLQGEHYCVQWHGVSLCRVAFQLLFGVSRRKLITAAQESPHRHGNSMVVHENHLTVGIVEFLDSLRRTCGAIYEDSQKVLLNGYYDRKSVWKAYVDTTPDEIGIASDAHFYAVWKSHRPDYIVETDSLKCPTCSSLDLQIHAKTS